MSHKPPTSISANPRWRSLTLSDGNVITFTGAAIGDKHWIQVTEPKDAASQREDHWPRLRDASYRYDAIFRPLEQLLVPKPPPARRKATRVSGKNAGGAHDDAAKACAEPVTSGASAGFGRRLAALLYDAVLLAATADDIYRRRHLFLTHGAALVPATVGPWAYLYRTGLLVLLAGYYLLNWLRSGQTLGMRAWHLRAVTDSGKPLTLKAAVLRVGFGLLAWAPAALGVLWLYLDPDHLALHDRLSKTRVVRLARS